MFGQLGAVSGQAGLFQQGFQVVFVAHGIQRGEKAHIVPHREQGIKGKILRHQRNTLPLFGRQPTQRHAVKQNLPALHRQQPGQKRHQRGFARAVGAEQAQRRSFDYRQAHAVERVFPRFGVAIGNFLYFNHKFLNFKPNQRQPAVLPGYLKNKSE